VDGEEVGAESFEGRGDDADQDLRHLLSQESLALLAIAASLTILRSLKTLWHASRNDKQSPSEELGCEVLRAEQIQDEWSTSDNAAVIVLVSGRKPRSYASSDSAGPAVNSCERTIVSLIRCYRPSGLPDRCDPVQ